MRKIVALLSLMLLGGCVTTGAGSIQNLKPVCSALVGPIQYNSADPKSRRYAGPSLVPDLQQRNQIGVNLKCPQYRE